MSPGSYVSSESAAESAGSSNSIDDTEIAYGNAIKLVLFVQLFYKIYYTLIK